MQYGFRLHRVLIVCTLVLVCFFQASITYAETYAVLKERRPELFHPQTGYRIEKQRSPTPDDIKLPAILIDANEVDRLIKNGALAVDVFGALQSRYDELDGTWLVSKARLSIPGAVWLPEVGRGVLEPQMQAYLEYNIKNLTDGSFDKPVIVFCVADCWMSWNASQRIAELGYKNVFWFRNGTDGWLDTDRTLEKVEPVPVNVE